MTTRRCPAKLFWGPRRWQVQDNVAEGGRHVEEALEHDCVWPLGLGRAAKEPGQQSANLLDMWPFLSMDGSLRGNGLNGSDPSGGDQ